MIKNGADVNAREEGKEKWSPLNCASSYGFKEIVELLITNGAHVNSGEATINTPLMCASSCGFKEIVELLIANKAPVNA